MSALQSGKIGMIGYFMAYMGQFSCILLIDDLAVRPLDLWDVLLFIFGIPMIIVGYFVARKDPYMKRLGWRILFWRTDKGRRGFAYAFITLGTLLAVFMIIIPRDSYLPFNPPAWFWIMTIGAIVAVIIGWVLVLTEREGNTSRT